MERNKIFAIPDKLGAKAGITSKWTLKGFTIYANKRVNVNHSGAPSEFAPCIPTIHKVSLDVILFDSSLQQFVNESCAVFKSGLNITNISDNEEKKKSLLRYSRSHRAVIHALIENLQEQIEQPTLTLQRKEELKSFTSIFYNVELIWHCVEILFIDTWRGSLVMRLMEWIRLHFFKWERRALEIIDKGYGPLSEVGVDSLPDFWDVATGLIIQGEIHGARALLNLHPDSNKDEFIAADEKMESMPVFSTSTHLTLGEFEIKFRLWQIDLQAQIEGGLFSTNKHLETIMEFMAGEESALEKVRPLCDTWYQMLSCWVQYKIPSLVLHNLSKHSKTFVQKYGPPGGPKLIDSILLAAMDADTHQTVKLLCELNDNSWCAVHVTHMLILSDNLPTDDKFSGPLQEHLFLDYGTILASDRSLWQVGVQYLEHCPRYGQSALELILSRLPATNESHALKIIKIAKDHGLQDLVRSLCKSLGMRAYKNGMLGTAISWAIRSEDAPFATVLADKFLEAYSRDDCYDLDNLLDNLSSCMLLCERLTFVGQYCEFHRKYKDKKFGECANILVSLLNSKLAPNFFIMTLLMDALPLLESKDLLFTISEISDLKRNLDELIGDDYEEENEVNYKNNDTKLNNENINLLRLALDRNLSRILE